MKKHDLVEFERSGFHCYINGNLAVLKLTCDAFQNLKDPEFDREILDWFDTVAEDERINGIVIINSPGCFGDTVYRNFLSEVSGKSLEDLELNGVGRFANSLIRSIEINILINFIRKIVDFPKITICCFSGEIVTPFIGLSLAADFRFLETDASYHFSHIKYAIHPSSALPFFLPLYVGQGKAMEILLTGGIMSSEEAVKLNLVNKTFPSEEFENHCIEEAGKICSISQQLIKTTKKLSNNFIQELDKYFEKESNFILR